MTEIPPQEKVAGPEIHPTQSCDSNDYVSRLGEERSNKASSSTLQNRSDIESKQVETGRFSGGSPKSPVLSTSDLSMDISPCTSNGNELDDFVIYSDSDGASQNSLELMNNKSGHIGGFEKDDKEDTLKADGELSRRQRSQDSRDRRGSNESSPSSRHKKRVRRKSNKSDSSARSHRSSMRHGEYPAGSGYTLTPATGKIFRNLLILEENLREHVIQQRELRRKYLTFLAILCSLIASITHQLYLIDSPVNGTVRVILQFTLLALTMTLMLYHLSGEYQKTIVLPRKFLSSTNKGLRQLNVRLIKIKTSFTDSITDLIRELILFYATMCLNCLHKVYPSMRYNKNSKLEVFLVSCQLQCQPRIGVADVKLVLNPRAFNTDVREGWELYRSEFWVHEGVRRRNNMMSFVTENYDDGKLDRGRLLKRDRKERKDRRKSSINTSPNKLNERNLTKLGNSTDNVLLLPFHSGMSGSQNANEVGER